MRRNWDVLVVGAGVAGLTAARAVAEAGLSCACVDRLGPGGALINLGQIHDCPDIPPETSGADFVASLLDAAVAAGAELVIGEVTGLAGGPPWIVRTDEEEHEARAVILATGLSPGSLGVAGEQDFEGRGLSHCAFCDGPMFSGRRVLVAGTDKWAMQEALELAMVVAHVTVIGEASAPEQTARLAGRANVSLILGRIVGLRGAEVLTGVEVERDGGRETLDVTGVFAYADRHPALSFTGNLLAADAAGHIVVDQDLRTNAPGIFAIGDVRAGAPETVVQAMADGLRAGLVASRLLTQHGASST